MQKMGQGEWFRVPWHGRGIRAGSIAFRAVNSGICSSVIFMKGFKGSIIHRIFESNSSFHVELCTTGKV